MTEHCENIGWTNRTYCQALTNCREMLKVLLVNVSNLPHESQRVVLKNGLNAVGTLIEELQVYGDRMEAKLEDQKTYRQMKTKYEKLEKEVEELTKTKESLQEIGFKINEST